MGRRFKDLPNVVWLVGGDYTPPAKDRWTVTDLASAIRQEDDRHLMSVHGSPETSGAAAFGQEAWLTVDTVYSYQKTLFQPLLAEYARKPARPFVLIESTYEGEHNSDPAEIRRQAYWSMLSGACGQFFGNNPIWHFNGPGLFPTKLTWIESLAAAGSHDMGCLRQLFDQLPWTELSPERNHEVVTDGYGKDIAVALTARTRNKKLAITYLPSTGTESRDLTVDTESFFGPVLTRWYNPASGNY